MKELCPICDNYHEAGRCPRATITPTPAKKEIQSMTTEQIQAIAEKCVDGFTEEMLIAGPRWRRREYIDYFKSAINEATEVLRRENAELKRDKETLHVIRRNLEAGAVTSLWVLEYIKRRDAVKGK